MHVYIHTYILNLPLYKILNLAAVFLWHDECFHFSMSLSKKLFQREFVCSCFRKSNCTMIVTLVYHFSIQESPGGNQ